MIKSPNSKPEGERADLRRDDITHAPPQPPAKVAEGEHTGMMGPATTESDSVSPGLGGGVSISTALEGVGMMLMGAQKLQSVMPGTVPPPIMQFLEALKITVPQALQDLATSGPGMMGALSPGEFAAQSALAASQQSMMGGMGGMGGGAPGMSAGMMPPGGGMPTGPSSMGAPPSMAPMAPMAGPPRPQLPPGVNPLTALLGG